MIRIKNITVNNVWLIGFRPFFGDDFISIKPFEEEAYSFFEKTMSPLWDDEELGSMFVKRNNYTYEQKLDKLNAFIERLRNDKSYSNPCLVKRSSCIGLPYVIQYHHIETGIDVEFDGIIFKTQKIFLEKSLSYLQAKEKVQENGSYQKNIEFNPKWHDLLMKSSGRTRWIYVSESSEFNILEIPNELRKYEFLGRLELIDKRFMRITFPVGHSEQGETFDFYLGPLEFIVQVLGNDCESYCYLRYLEGRLNDYGKRTLEIKNRLINPGFKLPSSPFGWFNFINWWKAVAYSNAIHQDLQSIIKTRMLLPLFKITLERFEKMVNVGTAYYNLPSPIVAVFDKDVKITEPTALNQHSTIAPLTLIEREGEIHAVYESKYSSFQRYPSRILNYLQSLEIINKEIYELIQSIATTTSLQSGIIAIIIAVIAIIAPYIITFIKDIINNLAFVDWGNFFETCISYFNTLIKYIKDFCK